MEKPIEIHSDNPQEEVSEKKTWVKPAMKTLNTTINSVGTGDSEGGTGEPS